MTHFRIMALIWLFGALGFVYLCSYTMFMGGFIYFKGGLMALVLEIFECVFSLAATVAGYGLLRGWSSPRIAIEVLAAVLLANSLIALFFSDVVVSERVAIFALMSLLALYSLTVALFVKNGTKVSITSRGTE